MLRMTHNLPETNKIRKGSKTALLIATKHLRYADIQIVSQEYLSRPKQATLSIP